MRWLLVWLEIFVRKSPGDKIAGESPALSRLIKSSRLEKEPNL